MPNKKREAIGYLARYLFPHAHSFRKEVEKCLNDEETESCLEDWTSRITEVRQEIHAYLQDYVPPTLAVKIERAKAALEALEEQEDTEEVGFDGPIFTECEPSFEDRSDV